jgi:hypothetical protein
MTPHPLFTGPVCEVRLEYVLRREREGDYLAKLTNQSAGTWTTGLGGNAGDAVNNALTNPLRRGRIGQDADDTTAEGQGPDATTAGVPA